MKNVYIFKSYKIQQGWMKSNKEELELNMPYNIMDMLKNY